MPRINALLAGLDFQSLQLLQEEEDKQIEKRIEKLYGDNPEQKALYYYEEQYPFFVIDARTWHSFTLSLDYLKLRHQLDQVIKKIIAWGSDYDPNAEVLATFLNQLERTDKAFFCGDGKKALETISVLLEENEIDINLRIKILHQLVSIAGLNVNFSFITGWPDSYNVKIIRFANRLKDTLESPNQINRWMRAYVETVAETVAAETPFAMPESYQMILFRLLNKISIEVMLSDANYYLLAQAKGQGFPIDIPSNTKTFKQIGDGLRQIAPSKNIITSYIEHLNEKVNAVGLVDYFAERLREGLNTLIADNNRTFLEKFRKISTKLDLLGEDKAFIQADIVDEDSFQLKNNSLLKITIVARLHQAGWFNTITEKEKRIEFTTIHYHHFPANMALTWFSMQNRYDRYLWTAIIQENHAPFLTDQEKISFLFDLFQSIDSIKDLDFFLSTLSSVLLLFPTRPYYEGLRIQSIQQLIKVFRDETSNINEPLRNYLSRLLIIRTILSQKDSISLIAKILRNNTEPLLFINIIRNLEILEAKKVLNSLGNELVQSMFSLGMNKSHASIKFFYLETDYFEQYYNTKAEQEALQVTKFLLKEIIRKGFRDFRGWIFEPAPYIHYLSELDLSKLLFDRAKFYEEIQHCVFDGSSLEETAFYGDMDTASFVDTDLRLTYFLVVGNSSAHFNLTSAQLSTEAFDNLIRMGITQYKYADLRAINFQKIMSEKALALDLTGTNLDNNNLSELDFTQIMLFGSRMKHASLVNTSLSFDCLDKDMVIQGAQITISTLLVFYRVGITSFDGCVIIGGPHNHPGTTSMAVVEYISFRGAQFIDSVYNLTFLLCNMDLIQFISSAPENPAELVNLVFNEVKLDSGFFHNVKFMGVKLINCSFDTGTLKNVEIQIDNLFEIYNLGHRDFTEVRKLTGRVPREIKEISPYYPLSEARLSQNIFKHLYKEGLRDFRGGDLTTFNFTEILRLESIDLFSLKLEGTRFIQSPLYCPIPPSPRCSIHFLLKKTALADATLISIDDLRYLIRPHLSGSHAEVKEALLGPMPFYSLRGGVGEISVYWGYEAKDEELTRLFVFIRDSIEMLQAMTIKLRIYIVKRFTSDYPLITLVQFLYYALGFRDGQIYYYNKEGAIAALDLRGDSIPISSGYDTLLSNKQFSSMVTDANLEHVHHTIRNQASRNSVYRLIRLQLEKNTKYRLPYTRKGGTRYELGLVLMRFVALWFVLQDIEFKALNIPESDRGTTTPSEISQEELAKIDARLFKIRWKIHNVGDKMSKNFDRQKAVFMEIQAKNGSYVGAEPSNETKLNWRNTTRSKPSKSSPSPIPPYYHKRPGMGIGKRTLPNWYDTPRMIRLMKEIQFIFSALGYDLSGDSDLSQSSLAGYLYEFWLILDNLGVSSDTPPKLILSFLQDGRFEQGTRLSSFSLAELQTLYAGYAEQYSNTTLTEVDDPFSHSGTLSMREVTDKPFTPANSSQLIEEKERDKRELTFNDELILSRDSATRTEARHQKDVSIEEISADYMEKYDCSLGKKEKSSKKAIKKLEKQKRDNPAVKEPLPLHREPPTLRKKEEKHLNSKSNTQRQNPVPLAKQTLTHVKKHEATFFNKKFQATNQGATRPRLTQMPQMQYARPLPISMSRYPQLTHQQHQQYSGGQQHGGEAHARKLISQVTAKPDILGLLMLGSMCYRNRPQYRRHDTSTKNGARQEKNRQRIERLQASLKKRHFKISPPEKIGVRMR